jgi:hypothetical protein
MIQETIKNIPDFRKYRKSSARFVFVHGEALGLVGTGIDPLHQLVSLAICGATNDEVKSSASRTRTYNIPVNSRMLYH